MFHTFALLLTALPLWAAPAFASQDQQEVEKQAYGVVGMDLLENQVNTFTYNRQQDAAVAADVDGNLLVAWGSRRQELGTFGIFAQLLDPRGRPLGTELHVNQFLSGEQAQPAVTFLPNGEALVLWHSVNQLGARTDLFARRFGKGKDGSFQALGDEFLVNQVIADDQLQATLCANSAGQTLAAWTGLQDGRPIIKARWLSTDGPLGDEFRLSDSELHQENLVSLASTSDGFIATWAVRNEAGYPEGLQGCLLTQDGETLARKPFLVSPGTDAFEVEPCVDSALDGSFVVTWMSTQSGQEYVVKARRFAADATPLATAFEVDAGGDGYRNGAQVAVAPDGRFAIAYNVNGPKVGSSPGHRPTQPCMIRLQRFAADGTKLGESFRLNRFNEGTQSLQVGLNAKHMLWTAQDQLLAAWHGNIGSDKRAVGLSLLVPEGFQPPAPPAIEPRPAAQDLDHDLVHGLKVKPDYDPNFIAPSYYPPPAMVGGSGGFEAIQNTGWNPPDPDLAVGMNHIVAVVNGEIAFFDKLGNQSYSAPIAGSGGFWGSVGAGGFVFDPVALYDPHSGRYVVAAADGAGSNDAICIAMSDDGDPNGTWHKYRFPISSTCSFYDFPNLGINEDTIFLAGDCFYGGGNRVFMWDKNRVMNGQSVSMKQIQTAGWTISLGASKNYDTASPGYFATTYSSSTNKVMLKAITNANTTPALHEYEVTVPSFSYPPGANQLGTSNLASTIDWRIKNGVVRNGSFWVAHNTGGNGAKVRWYEFSLNGWPNSGQNPTMRQSGLIDLGNGEHTWFPDINVTDNGDAVLAYNRSSSIQYIGIEFCTRRAGDPLGTFGPSKEMQRSTSPELGSRWGDYAGVEQDPADPATFWNHHEYRTNGWRTWVGEFAINLDLQLSSGAVVAGGNTFLDVSGALAGESVHYLASLSLGSTAPPQLGGLILDLGSVIYLGNSVANASGQASFVTSVPTGAPVGANAYLQAVVQRGVGGADSVKSNLVTEVIQ